jgi:DNA-binding response OmpR family regulator
VRIPLRAGSGARYDLEGPAVSFPAIRLKLLLVDDDPKFRGFMQRGLEESGMSCEAASNGDEAWARLSAAGTGAFDLVLLDVMMPGSSGWEVLEKMRASGDATPVIFLTARHAVEERVKGLRLGADDYIIKPFDFSELLARIEAVRRRHMAAAPLVVDTLRIDLERRVVECHGVRIEMSPREFELLLALARAKGQALSRPELLKQVWGMDFDPGTNVVNVLVARLRRRIEPWAPGLIRTVPRGYALGPQAREAASR